MYILKLTPLSDTNVILNIWIWIKHDKYNNNIVF